MYASKCRAHIEPKGSKEIKCGKAKPAKKPTTNPYDITRQ